MKKIAMILSIFVIAALAVLVFSVPAQAGVKERGTDEIDETWDADGYCEFTLTVHQVGSLKWSAYTDDEGCNHYRETDVNFRQEIYAKGYPDKVLKLRFQGPYGWDDLTPDGSVWIYWVKGQWQHITIPGYGTVLGRAGNLAEKWDCSGEECIFDTLKLVGLNRYGPEELAAMCDYLRP